MKLVVIACVAVLFISLTRAKFCKEFEGKVKHEFYPLRHCQRSNKTVIYFTNVESFEDCVEFTRNHRGLAFNFSPLNRFKKNLFELKKQNESSSLKPELVEEDFYNCEVLECPEYRNFSSIVNDTRFDYYSLYTRPPRELKNLLKKLFTNFNFSLSE
jgi:hypothetical protein